MVYFRKPWRIINDEKFKRFRLRSQMTPLKLCLLNKMRTMKHIVTGSNNKKVKDDLESLVNKSPLKSKLFKIELL